MSDKELIKQLEEIERLNKEREIDIKYNKYLQKEIVKANSIIKEAREFISNHFIADDGAICKELEERFCEINYSFIDELLEILDKENT